MSLSKPTKRILIIFAIIIAAIFIVIFTVNQFAASILEGKLRTALAKNETEYRVNIRDVGGNIFFGNIRLKDIEIIPDSSLLQAVKEGTASTVTAFQADIPLLRITGVGIFDALVNKQIGLNTIELRDADIKIYKGKSHGDVKIEKQKQKQTFNPDSIFIKNVSGISIGDILLRNNTIRLWDLENDSEILTNKMKKFEISNFKISKHSNVSDLFYLDVEKLNIHIASEEFDLPGGDYILSFQELDFSIADSTLKLHKFKLRPTWDDKFKMAAQWKYNREIYDLEVEEIDLHSVSLLRLVTEGHVFIDSISVNKLNANIFKDQRYPFDELKRPLLPDQLLKTMNFPLYIGAVRIDESRLVYQEKYETAEELMTVELAGLNAELSFITSVKDSIKTEKPMEALILCKIMNKASMRVEFLWPLHTKSDIFYFSGSVGSTNLSLFDKAAYPAMGAKFYGGKLNSLDFQASATSTTSKGEMTMLYENLDAEITKKETKDKNKFLSWAANTVIRTGNPGSNGKIRVAEMSFDRTMYKGFGNFFWKTLLSGIVNTVSPAGKNIRKEDTSMSEQAKEESSELTAKERRKNKRKNK